MKGFRDSEVERVAPNALGASGVATHEPVAWGQAAPPRANVVAVLACFGALFLPLVSHAAAAPRTTTYEFRGEAVKVSVSSSSLYAPNFGFAPFRITTESTDARDLDWRLNVQAPFHSNYGSSAESFAQSIRVPARRVSERWAFVPTAGDGLDVSGTGYAWTNFTGTLAGRGLEPSLFTLSATPMHHTGGVQMIEPCAASLSVEPAVRAWLNRRASGNLNLVAFDPAQPVGDWRAWSAFGHVVLTVAEYEALDPTTRVSLQGWVALGGALHLLSDGAATEKKHGAGNIVTQPRPRPGRTEPTPAVRTGGAAAAPAALTEEDLFANLLLAVTPAQPARHTLQLSSTGFAASVPASKKGGDWLLYFFVLFAILIAPVNLFALAPARQRHRLFLTVPAFSLGAVLILGVIIFVQDGSGGSGARRAIVVLLPGENQAAIFQEQVTQTGLLLRSSFPLPDDTLCAQTPVGQGTAGSELKFRREEGVASGDWFRSRARQAQHLRRLTPTRARVELVGTGPDGAPKVQSSIGTTLREFLYVDASGVWWFAAEIGAGKRVTLSRIALSDARDRFPSQFVRGASEIFRQIAREAGAIGPRHGGFVARAGDNELAPLPTLAAIDWKESEVVFTGVVEGKALR